MKVTNLNITFPAIEAFRNRQNNQTILIGGNMRFISLVLWKDHMLL